MDNLYSSDKPIENEKDDRFQRYGFAKRIATTIKERQSTDCIVLGLYGAWGEGKTSVLNFIETELIDNEDIVVIKFNPWRFKDEDALLIDFFNLLANKLNTSLKTNSDKAISLIKKYSGLTTPAVKFIPLVGSAISDAIKQVNELLPSEDTEELKKRIDEILTENGKKIVVVIDDIDRLEKNEVHAIFRLVKLTADFYNTTYILSFDESVIAAAIGERFGEGNIQAGKSFLEKIIQVPLNLPVAHQNALQQFCFDIINNTLNQAKITLTEDEGKEFSNYFQSNILLRLNTPRLAIRFGNSLSFSIPLLYGEVNIDDLLLIEAIKTFYPNHYEFVKLNPDFFIGSYKELYGHNSNKEKIELLNTHLHKLGNDLTVKEKSSIKTLLIYLFPRLNEVYHNHVYTDWIEQGLYKNMRIASPKHFNRFFTYAVIKGDLSDVAFKNFLLNIKEQSINVIANEIKELVRQSSAENFLIKIRSYEDDYSWEVAKKLAEAITIITEIFPKHKELSFMRFQSPYSQSQIFIHQLIKKHTSKSEGLELGKELINKSNTFEYAYDFNDWFRTFKEENRIFSEEQLLEIDHELIKRALKESKELSIFERFEDKISHIINSWAKINHAELIDYAEQSLKQKPCLIMNILRIYTPTIWSSSYPQPYKIDFSEDYYKHFISIFDKDYIEKSILNCYTIDEIKSEDVIWVGRDKNTQTDLNIIRQFFYWKNNSETNTSS